MNIYVLPALSGDCMIVDFSNGKCVLIDGGYRGTYPKLRELLSELCNEGKQLEYVILTHYDRDHIAGLIEFVQDNGKKGNEKIISVDHIVYNDFSYLYAKKPLIGIEPRQDISYHQLKTFESLCHENGWDDLNEPIVSGQRLDGLGYQIRIISPSLGALEKCKAYEKQNNHHKEPNPVSGKICRDLKDWLELYPGSELNAINKASIAFEIISEEKKLLFCGDADMRGYGSLLLSKYDVIKLSHHGSYFGNECFCGENAVVADRFIVSTNGSRNEHPNRRLLAELLMQPYSKTLYLNYDISGIDLGKYHLLYNTKQQKKYKFSTVMTNTINFED